MIGRVLHRRDFERVLATPPCSRSAHFALYHLYARPSTGAKAPGRLEDPKLCTDHSPISDDPVDKDPLGRWAGSVVPKRHARRAVTRNMLRRQIRAAIQRHEQGLRPGIWLVRLRQPFAATAFVSADSGALRAAAASELDRLLIQAGP